MTKEDRAKKANRNSAKAKSKKTAKNKIRTRITHLEMLRPLAIVVHPPSRPVTAMMVAKNIQSDFYAFLYEQVGRNHHWFDRRHMKAEELQAIVNNETCQIAVLYADGCPAGFYELNLANMPDFVEIRYFGLIKHYHGMGLGKWFLSLAIKGAWSHQPNKVIVETNTLDHPAALRLYQRFGFEPVAVSDAEIEPWQ